MVVAKGKNYLALRIREIARESGVPLVENPLLAQALYKSVDVGREIPPHLYRAVAEVLAYIYKLTRTRSQGRRKIGSNVERIVFIDKRYLHLWVSRLSPGRLRGSRR